MWAVGKSAGLILRQMNPRVLATAQALFLKDCDPEIMGLMDQMISEVSAHFAQPKDSRDHTSLWGITIVMIFI